MATYQLAVLVGSLRHHSLNRKLADALAMLGPSAFLFKQVRIGDLPLYNQDDDNQPSEPVQRLRSEIAAAQGLLFVTPEYNRSIPGVLKNAIDHASRPYGQNAFAGKPAGIIGASVGTIGTAAAQQHLRSVLGYLDVATMGQPEAFVHAVDGLFEDNGNFSETPRPFFQKWMDAYAAWVKRHAV